MQKVSSLNEIDCRSLSGYLRHSLSTFPKIVHGRELLSEEQWARDVGPCLPWALREEPYLPVVNETIDGVVREWWSQAPATELVRALLAVDERLAVLAAANCCLDIVSTALFANADETKTVLSTLADYLLWGAGVKEFGYEDWTRFHKNAEEAFRLAYATDSTPFFVDGLRLFSFFGWKPQSSTEYFRCGPIRVDHTIVGAVACFIFSTLVPQYGESALQGDRPDEAVVNAYRELDLVLGNVVRGQGRDRLSVLRPPSAVLLGPLMQGFIPRCVAEGYPCGGKMEAPSAEQLVEMA